MYQEITQQTVEWLAATGAPNAALVLTLLTEPATWSRAVKKRITDTLDRFTNDTEANE